MGLQSGVSEPTVPSKRLLSLDAYRGFTMLAMISAGLGLQSLRGHPSLGWLAHQVEHRTWEGCSFWDLIQPSFLFIVGVAMPFAFAIRESQGQSWGRQFGHALKRSLLLIAIGIFLDSQPLGFVQVQFLRVLQQIALGYLVAFLVLPLVPLVQVGAVAVLLIGHTAAYLIYAHATGYSAWALPPPPSSEPWLSANVGVFIDREELHLPLSAGNYVTFNAVSSAATIIIGVLCGELLKGGLSPYKKVLAMTALGAGCLAAGGLLSGGDGWLPISFTPAVPMIKRLWTSSFAIFAAGWTFLALALFYLVIDVIKLRKWSFVFVVVGLNSIAIYTLASLFSRFVNQSLYLAASLVRPLFPSLVTAVPSRNEVYAFTPILQATLMVFVFWLVCFWLYRRRIFFKV